MKVKANGVYFNCRVEGASGAPWLILSNSLSSNLSMWEPQVPVLSQRFRILRYDQRGHGSSTATEGDYSFDLLSDDVIALMNALNIEHCHFIGLSMGGMTAIPLALNHTDRFNSIIISNSRADMNEDFRRSFDERINGIRGWISLTLGVASAVRIVHDSTTVPSLDVQRSQRPPNPSKVCSGRPIK